MVELDESLYRGKVGNANFDEAKTIRFNGFGYPDNAGYVALSSSMGGVIVVHVDSAGNTSKVRKK